MSNLNSLYCQKSDEYYENRRFDIIEQISIKPRRVLDIGCGSGSTLKLIKEHFPNAITVGIEAFKEAAENARKVCDEVHCLDLNECQLSSSTLGEYDLIMCSDVLEHLVDPQRTLKELKELLSPNGVLLISLPNIRFIGVSLPLLLWGKFEYQDSGILDKTHLRFYTKSSAKKMIENSGYTIDRIVPSKDANMSITNLIRLLSLGLAQGFTSRQFIFRAQKS